MTRNIEFSPGEYYHLYNRGTDRREIFTNLSDYSRFSILLYLCNSDKKVDLGDYFRQGLTLSEIFQIDLEKKLVSIGSYCLMPNHFHILVREQEERGTSLFMQKLQTAYTMYFNNKHNRSGSLFQGTFKARHVKRDIYLKYLFAYINLNPIKIINPQWKEKGIHDLYKSDKYLTEYKYSSFLDLIGVDRMENIILDVSKFPEYFNSDFQFKDFIRDWLKFKEDDNNPDKV